MLATLELQDVTSGVPPGSAVAHPLLARIHEGIGDYHWDTPAFRETCFAMRVPPEEVRPVFRALYAELASALLAGCAERFGK